MNSETVKRVVRTFLCNPDTYRSITLSDIEQYEGRPTYEAIPLPTGGTLVEMGGGRRSQTEQRNAQQHPQLRKDNPELSSKL